MVVAAAASSTEINNGNIKFLCSYNGKIVPRYPDGKLRYHGGHTRVLSVHRSVSFAELMVKVRELCGDASMSLRCQLPTEDLDALVSITSDEDLANLIEEYEKASATDGSLLKIRAFLFPSKPVKKVASPPSTVSSPSSTTSSPFSSVTHSGSSLCMRSSRCPAPVANRCYRSRLPPPMYRPGCYEKSSGRISPSNGYHQIQSYAAASSGGHAFLVHNGNHWQ